MSFYAGPITEYCRRFVKQGGLIVANNSHGDAGIAALTPDVDLVGVVLEEHKENDGRFVVHTEDCAQFVIPKRAADKTLTRAELIERGRGVPFTRAEAAAYVFRVK